MNSHKLRKPIAISAAASIAVLALAGCSSSASGPTNEATPEVTSSTGGAETSGTGQQTLAPAGFNKPVAYPSGVTVSVVKAERVTVAAQGPGEVSGAGVRFNVKVTNNSGSKIDLNNVAINAFYGTAKTPASPAPSSAPPFSGSLNNGSGVEASYVFVMPQSANPVEMQFSYATTQPVAIFVGKV